MRKGFCGPALLALVSAHLFGFAAVAQDFQKIYRLPEGGYLRIGNVSGNITVNGYEGDGILVRGYREGRDREYVQIEDTSSGDRVELKVRFAENCNCSASVSFEVQVPRATSYVFERLSSVSGDVSVTGVQGRLRAESVSGDVIVREVAGLVSASTVSGDVEVDINRLAGTGDMKFSSVSGDVHVRVPAGLDADIEMSSLSGSLKTDLPIEVRERRYGPGRSARARLGTGARTLKLSTVSGRVSLTRR